MIPSGRIWPNGEFSLGYTRVGEELDQAKEWSWTGGERGLTPDELDERLEYMHSWLEYQGAVAACPAPMALHIFTLSSVPDSHNPTLCTAPGLKGMTGYGMKMVRSGCYLLEKRLGREDCVMITLTVPTLGRDSRVRLAREWGVVTNRLVQYLTRELVKSGRTPAIIGCVEVQTSRLEKYRQAYLHLHLVCPAHSNRGGVWAVDVGDLRTWWARCIERTIGSSLPHMPRVETAIVEKSVEGYLGKYLSKGGAGELAEFIGDLGEEAVPAQWWFASAPMKKAIKSGTASGQNAGALLDVVVNNLLEQGDGEGFEYIRHIDCIFNNKPVTVGYVGRLTPGLRADLLAFLDKDSG